MHEIDILIKVLFQSTFNGNGMKYELHILLRYVNTYYVTSSMNVGIIPIIHGLECRKCKLCIIVLYIIKYKDIDYR